MDRTFSLIAALAGFIGVTLGAFGAHGLRNRLSADMLGVFETGVRYHLVHALAILLVSVILSRATSTWIVAAGWFFTGGIVLFSGSLYLMALTGARGLGAITPLGGLAFLLGWASLAWAAAWR